MLNAQVVTRSSPTLNIAIGDISIYRFSATSSKIQCLKSMKVATLPSFRLLNCMHFR